MRFISDIIKDKRRPDDTKVRSPEARQNSESAEKPLLLETPLARGTHEKQTTLLETAPDASSEPSFLDARDKVEMTATASTQTDGPLAVKIGQAATSDTSISALMENTAFETPTAVHGDAMSPLADANAPCAAVMPPPTLGRGAARPGRVKTRLLGFSAAALAQDNPFDKPKTQAGERFAVGWLVVVAGSGRGASFALYDGVSTVGRGPDQTICLDFGDTSISRSTHMSVAFDAEQGKFFVGHSGKANLVRVNNMPLLSTEELCSRDMIRLGETTLRFIAFCDENFGWDTDASDVAQSA